MSVSNHVHKEHMDAQRKSNLQVDWTMWTMWKSGGDCMIAMADLSPSISLSDECLIIIKEGMTWEEFWYENEDEQCEDKNSQAIIHIDKDKTIVSLFDDLRKAGLEDYFYAIFIKWQDLVRGEY